MTRARRAAAVMLAVVMVATFSGCGNGGAGSAASQTVAEHTSPVPDVVGLDLEDATRVLEDAGFKVLVGLGDGSIVGEQAPASGAEARDGYAVLLTRGLSDAQRAAVDAKEAKKDAAEAAEAAEKAQNAAAEAAAEAAALIESEMCGPFRAELNDPAFSSTQIAYHGVKDDRVAPSMSSGFVPLDEFVAACPEFAGLFTDMQTKIASGQVFDAGTYEVGVDVPAGKYKTTGTDITDCYWSRTTPGGSIIANDFIGYAPAGVTISVRAGEGLEVSDACGLWAGQ